MGKSVLTIETLVPDRDFIEVVRGEKRYKIELRDEGELSLPEIARVVRAARKIAPGLGSDASPENLEEAEQFANDVLGIVLVPNPDLPMPELMSMLKILQKFEIVSAFTVVGARKRAGRQPTAEVESPAKTPIGDASSPGSVDSTVAN